MNSLTDTLNPCIEKNHYSSEFKKAELIPLPKTLHKTNLTDYRPVSLLSVLSKLLEKRVHVQLNDYLEEKNTKKNTTRSPLPCKHSCNTALVRLTHSWLTARNRSEVSGVIFLDIKKGIWSRWSQYHDVQVWMPPSKFKFSTVLQIVSWRQNA